MNSSNFFSAFFVILLMLFGWSMQAQDDDLTTTKFDGKVMPALVTTDNDTLLLIDLQGVPISSPRSFANADERRKYYKYRRYAKVVYPYALEAIQHYRDVQEVESTQGKKARKKFVRQRHKDLKHEFKDQLKDLTKTQGYILIKMVEREVDAPMYDVIKDMRSGWHAFTYNVAGNVNGYSLKEGYVRGQDRILDIVLDDFILDLQVQ